MTLHVLITVDTESFAAGHPDDQIWGKMDTGREFGIRMIMDKLERYGFKGTFYVNVYEAERVGEDAIRAVIAEIHTRGHDVELHSHPRDRYGTDKLTRADASRQTEILAWGKEFIERETGVPVLAHRAGAFAANLNTIEALNRLGIRVDSSLSPAWFESHLSREVESNNRPFILRGILELPVTYYVQARIGTKEYLRIVDVEACSIRELKSIVRQAIAAKVGALNILLHSNTFVRTGKVNAALVRRFDSMLAYLTTVPDLKLSSTREYFAVWLDECADEDVTVPFKPYTGFWLTYLRTLELFGKDLKNTLVAVLPPLAIVALLVTFFLVS